MFSFHFFLIILAQVFSMLSQALVPCSYVLLSQRSNSTHELPLEQFLVVTLS